MPRCCSLTIRARRWLLFTWLPMADLPCRSAGRRYFSFGDHPIAERAVCFRFFGLNNEARACRVVTYRALLPSYSVIKTRYASLITTELNPPSSCTCAWPFTIHLFAEAEVLEPVLRHLHAVEPAMRSVGEGHRHRLCPAGGRDASARNGQ